jgi:hypothetical protein
MRTVKQQIESIKRTRKNEALLGLKEDAIQMQIVTVLQSDPKYAAIKDLWTFDPHGVLKLPAHIGKKINDLGRRKGNPDFVLSGLFLLTRKFNDEKYVKNAGVRKASFHIELKKPDFKLRKKNGQIVGQGTKNEHVYQQWLGVKKLRSVGCYAQFAKGKTDFFRKLDIKAECFSASLLRTYLKQQKR